jgi:hypothetical protein
MIRKSYRNGVVEYGWCEGKMQEWRLGLGTVRIRGRGGAGRVPHGYGRPMYGRLVTSYGRCSRHTGCTGIRP